jgi:hypothetical protein
MTDKKKPKDYQMQIIKDIIDFRAVGYTVQICHLICKKYEMSIRNYRRYKKIADQYLINQDTADIKEKILNAEMFYQNEIKHLMDYKYIDDDTKKELTDFQRHTLILKARQQLDKIQGIEIQTINNNNVLSFSDETVEKINSIFKNEIKQGTSKVNL